MMEAEPFLEPLRNTVLNTFNGLHLSTMRSIYMFVSERQYIYDGSVLFLFLRHLCL